MSQPLLFALQASREYGARVAAHLGIDLGAHEERAFEDGEFKIRPLQSVRGRHVFVLTSLYSDPDLSVNDKLLRLLMFTGALRDASAREISLILPYLAYARKDRRTKSRDPLSLRYLAEMIEAVGADRVVCFEVHNPAAYENAFRRVAEHLKATSVFLRPLLPELRSESVAVVSPDAGGYKRAQDFREQLARALDKEASEVELAFVEKKRSAGELTHGRLVGSVTKGTVIIIDDLIVTGRTLVHAARACKAQGASRVLALATHGVFHPSADQILADPALDRIVVTDTVPPWRIQGDQVKNKMTVLSATDLTARAIETIHTHGSLTRLMEEIVESDM
ncbi:MAG: ribose-phosphate diphosphokinase [Methylohalobius sp. ZOD2]